MVKRDKIGIASGNRPMRAGIFDLKHIHHERPVERHIVMVVITNTKKETAYLGSNFTTAFTI